MNFLSISYTLLYLYKLKTILFIHNKIWYIFVLDKTIEIHIKTKLWNKNMYKLIIKMLFIVPIINIKYLIKKIEKKNH